MYNIIAITPIIIITNPVTIIWIMGPEFGLGIPTIVKRRRSPTKRITTPVIIRIKLKNPNSIINRPFLLINFQFANNTSNSLIIFVFRLNT